MVRIFVNIVGERVRKTAARKVVLNKPVPGWYDFWLKWEAGGNEALNFSQPERQRSQRSFCQKGSCWRMRERMFSRIKTRSCAFDLL
jgi:hypothetical protein